MPFTEPLPAENTDPWYAPIVTSWEAIQLFVNSLETAVNARVTNTTFTNALAGKADLISGKVPEAQLPSITINDTFTVASQAAMLALTAEKGDIAIRTDLAGEPFVLAASPASTLGNWKSLGAGGSQANNILVWTEVTGAYPALPGTKPTGVQMVVALGNNPPNPATIPSWGGGNVSAGEVPFKYWETPLT